jgi:hypothetical protein
MSAISKIGSTAVGLMMAALGGVPVAHAQAGAEVSTSADVAQAKADDARTDVEKLEQQGGPAYKSGAVDRAKGQAARYQSEANAVRAEETAGPAAPAATPSPALAAAEARLARLRMQSGQAYKSGELARAEAEVRALEAAETGAGAGVAVTAETARLTTSSAEGTERPANWGKPVEQSSLRPGP